MKRICKCFEMQKWYGQVSCAFIKLHFYKQNCCSAGLYENWEFVPGFFLTAKLMLFPYFELAGNYTDKSPVHVSNPWPATSTRQINYTVVTSFVQRRGYYPGFPTPFPLNDCSQDKNNLSIAFNVDQDQTKNIFYESRFFSFLRIQLGFAEAFCMDALKET